MNLVCEMHEIKNTSSGVDEVAETVGKPADLIKLVQHGPKAQ